MNSSRERLPPPDGGRTVVAADAATLRDSPVSRRSIRRRGAETVSINHSIHMIGALCDGAPDLQLHDALSASSYIWLVEHLIRRYRKVGIIADNASAIEDMKKCLEDADGAVNILHLPPHAPQLNPI